MLEFVRNFLERRVMRAMYLPFVKIQNDIIKKIESNHPAFSGYTVLEFNKETETFTFKVKGNFEVLPEEVIDYLSVIPSFVEGLIVRTQLKKQDRMKESLTFLGSMPEVLKEIQKRERGLGF